MGVVNSLPTDSEHRYPCNEEEERAEIAGKDHRMVGVDDHAHGFCGHDGPVQEELNYGEHRHNASWPNDSPLLLSECKWIDLHCFHFYRLSTSELRALRPFFQRMVVVRKYCGRPRKKMQFFVIFATTLCCLKDAQQTLCNPVSMCDA